MNPGEADPPHLGQQLVIAAEADAWDDVMHLMRSWPQLFHEHPDDLIRALELMPDDMLDRQPRLRLAREHVRNHRSGRTSSRAYPDVIRVTANASPIDALAALTGQVAVAREAGRFDEAVSKAQQAIRHLAAVPVELTPTLSNALPELHYQWGLAFEDVGRLMEALDQYRSGFDWAESVGHRAAMTTAAGAAASLHALAGRAAEAERWLRRIPADTPESWWASYASTPASIAAALVHHDRLQTVEAGASISRIDASGAKDHWGAYFFVRALITASPRTAQDILIAFDGHRAGLPLAQRRGRANATYVALTRYILFSALSLPSRAARALGSGIEDDRHPLLRQIAALFEARRLLRSGDSRAARRLTAPLTHVSSHEPAVLIPALLIMAEVVETDERERLVDRAVALATAHTRYSDFGWVSESIRSRAAVRLERDGERAVAERLRAMPAATDLDAPDGLHRLSVRERMVVWLVLEGISNTGIAERLHVSVNTIKAQRRSAYRKLGVTSRDALQEKLELDP